MAPITEKPVLVTGVTGYIGSHAAVALLNEGYRVRGSLRSLKKADAIRENIGKLAPTDKLEFVEADLLAPESWHSAVAGVEFVHHVASPVPSGIPKDENELIVPARDGTLNVLRASAAAGVRRIVVTSSVAAIGTGRAGDPSGDYTEHDWTDATHRDASAYVKSKTIAERAAWDFVRDEAPDLELATINPVYVLGPVLSPDTSASVKIVSKVLMGELPAVPRLSFPIVDVRDVAAAHIAAMVTPEAAGKRFIVNSETVWYSDIIDVLRAHVPETSAKKLPRFAAPNFLLRVFALFDEDTRSVIGGLGVRRHFVNTQAREVLGWNPRSMAESVAATADSLFELQMV